ncbi:MAG TPA: hypothetical protein VFF59_11395 [Anaerolineae bacterium]|nr:hypothetical protein [Anaerolineae bacterium]
MDAPYLETLKAFVEGKKALREWPSWWRDNASLIEQNEGRTRYLKIKLEWQAGACAILDFHGLAYELNTAVNWNRCRECGALLFHAKPGETTKESIRKFVKESNLPGKEIIEREGWIHPGTHCPNGCTALLVEYRVKIDYLDK